MKKKLLSVLLAVTLMAGMLTGCGEKTDDKEDKEVENVQDDTQGVDDSQDQTADSNAVDLGNGMMMEYPGEDDGLIEMEGEVTVIEGDVADSADADWENAYNDYFAREDIVPEKVKMSMTTEAEGISMEIVVAVAGEASYMHYGFDAAKLDIYALDGKVYAGMEMAGETSWIYAEAASEDEVDSVMSMSGETTIVDPESVVSCTYVETVVEGDITYDVLLLEVDDGSTTGKAYYYVNRESQKIGKCIMEQDSQTVECFVEEISSIELPAEAAEATEGTMEDIAGALFAVMFSAMG